MNPWTAVYSNRYTPMYNSTYAPGLPMYQGLIKTPMTYCPDTTKEEEPRLPNTPENQNMAPGYGLTFGGNAATEKKQNQRLITIPPGAHSEPWGENQTGLPCLLTIKRLTAPSATVLMLDSIYMSGDYINRQSPGVMNDSASSGKICFRHKNRANCGFADGHAAAMDILSLARAHQRNYTEAKTLYGVTKNLKLISAQGK